MIKSAKILLIGSPYNRLKGKCLPNFPLGLGYIAANLEKHGFSTAIYEADNMKLEERGKFKQQLGCSGDMKMHRKFIESFDSGFEYIWAEVRKVVAEYSPNIVGISAITPSYCSALNIAKVCKEIDQRIAIVLGGSHPTVLPEETLREDCIDFVVRGEGEVTFLELVESIYEKQNYKDIRGLSYKEDGHIKHNPPRNLMNYNNLDKLPFPARHLLINSSCYDKNTINGLFREVSISRGCPFNCTFCASNNIWGRHWRFRSVHSVIEETINLIDTYGVRDLRFWSDTITANRKWVLEFCEKIKTLNITWTSLGRVDSIDEEMVKAMQEAGCREIALGIESGSDRVLNKIGKKITVAHVKEAAGLMKRCGMKWGTFFMIGFPCEFHKDIMKTFKLIKELKPTWYKIAVPVPYPGTCLYEEVKSKDLLDEGIDWKEYDGRSSKLSCVTNISKNDFIKLRSEIIAYIDRYNRRQDLKELFFNMLNLLRRNPLLFLKKALYKIMMFWRRYIKY